MQLIVSLGFLAIVYHSFSQEFLAVTDQKYEGYALLNTSYKTLQTDSFASCLFQCHKDLRCMSINYKIVKQLCELNSQNKDSLPNMFEAMSNTIYATSLEKRDPGK